MKVVIDGIVYVPRAEIPEMTDERRDGALRALTSSLYLYGKPESGINNDLWDALRSLAPELAELGDPKVMYDRVRGED